MPPASGASPSTRRNERSRRAILDATFELIARKGYTKVTIESIAAAAGVGKPTIYRWWSSKGALALETINDKFGGDLGFPDTGDIAADLTTQITEVVRLFNSDIGTVFRGIIGEAQSDPDLNRSVRDTIVEPNTRACELRLVKAIAVGQLRADIPTRVMVEQLYAPLFYRLLIRTDPLTPKQVPELIDNAFHGLQCRA